MFIATVDKEMQNVIEDVQSNFISVSQVSLSVNIQYFTT